jgi:hypothetical protein
VEEAHALKIALLGLRNQLLERPLALWPDESNPQSGIISAQEVPGFHVGDIGVLQLAAFRYLPLATDEATIKASCRVFPALWITITTALIAHYPWKL